MPEPKKNDPIEDPKPEPKTYTEDAFNKVLDESKKAKKARNAAQAELDELRIKNEDNERAALEAKSEYKDLYEAERSRNTELKSQMSDKDTKFIEATKRSAVNDALGGFKKPEYMKFIDTSKILMDDIGNVDSSTVDNEVIRLKQEYPELIKSSKSSRLPNEAPVEGSEQSKKPSEMSANERNDTRRKLIEARMSN